LLAVALLAFSSAPASAAPGRSILRTISTGTGSQPESLATDSDGNLYVLEVGRSRIAKFDSTGTPVPFSASAPYIEGNRLTGTPEGPFVFPSYTVYSHQIAVDRSGGPTDGYIYVTNLFSYAGSAVYVFDPSGAYKGRLDRNTGQTEGASGDTTSCGVAVNQATGEIYTAAYFRNTVLRFSPSTGSPESNSFNGRLKTGAVCPIAVDSTGAVYVGAAYGGGNLTKYDASQFGSPAPVSTQQPGSNTGPVAVDPVSDSVYADQGQQIAEYSPAGTLVGVPFGTLTKSYAVAGDGSGNVLAADNDGILVFGHNQVDLPLASVAEASNIEHNSADIAGEVDPDSAGGVIACEVRYGPDGGYNEGSVPCSPAATDGSPITSPTPVSAHLSGLEAGTAYHYRLFVTNANGTTASADRTFTTPAALEGVTTGAPIEVSKDSAVVGGSYTGDGQDTHYYFEYATNAEYGANFGYSQSTPAPPGIDNGSGTGPQEAPPVTIAGLQATTTYHYRLVAVNSYGKAYGQDEIFTTASAITNLSTDSATGITATGVDLHGSYDADKYDVHYYFEYGQSTSYGSTLPVPPGDLIPSGSGRQTVPAIHVPNLQPGSTYHYRIVASNDTGISFGEDATFVTFDRPAIGNLSTANVTATSAILKGEIDANGAETRYHFEWGTTTSYGNSMPVPDADIGPGTNPVPVSVQIEGLEPGITYHFRLIAESENGKDVSVDQSFGFYPPSCPNSQVRQETGSNHLPDCRGYEIVTPGDSGGPLLVASSFPSTPYATSPSRIGFAATYGTFAGTGEATNGFSDPYVATRTDAGWHTKYVGLPVTATPQVGGPPLSGVITPRDDFTSQLGSLVSSSLDRVANFDRGFLLSNNGVYEKKVPSSNAPYVWDTSTGDLIERWPSNLASVTEGERFVGVPRASADFTHFVFSSTNVIFAPGGEISPTPPIVQFNVNCCSGSIYDNDVDTGEVRLASLDEDNHPFKGSVMNVSEDGSRILMAENEPFEPSSSPYTCVYNEGCQPKVQVGLYLRVNGVRTYDIAPGHTVQYVGATADGTTVYLTSTEQLTADDTDSSSDLFVWHQSDPGLLTRVSTGTGSAGNSDSCSFPWVDKCGAVTISVPRIGDTGFLGNGHSDSPIARDSGDIYFESPEQLVGGKGEFGQVNLYVYRHGAVQFVATLKDEKYCVGPEGSNDPGGCSPSAVGRIQVTRNGSRAAFITVSRLTAYDNAGHSEMYTFTPATSQINCVSCRTDGQPPTREILGSQNGLFLTEDGRTFFTTAEPLAPRDTNEAHDVYEYTEGKAQLISTGLGQALISKFQLSNQAGRLGLIGVSANGTDVYFVTLDNLVTQDHNKPEQKIYDARTGGGFPAEAPVLKCEAADECHGPIGEAPALPAGRTSASLGNTKRHAAHRKKHRKQHTRNKKKRAKAKQRQSRSTQGRNHRG
jgi:hypothetical protein